MSIETFSDKTCRYLRQQREIYGNVLYLDNRIITEMKQKKQSNIEQKINDNKLKSGMKEGVLFNEPADLNSNQTNWKSSKTLDELFNNIGTCMNCPLGKTRNKFVFGAGNPNASLMIIGEAPGADEDRQGIPFIGRAGQLLTKILASIGLSRDEVFIGNIIKCRPPANRRPEPSEVSQCEPYLKKQIELIKPAFILALGLTAVDTMLKAKHKMGEIRGTMHDYHGINMFVTYHPAALLRNSNLKKLVWEDVKHLKKLLDDYELNK